MAISTLLEHARITPSTHDGLMALVGRVHAEHVQQAIDGGDVRTACVLMAALAGDARLLPEWIRTVLPRVQDTRWIPWLLGRGPRDLEADLPRLVDSAGSDEARALLTLCGLLLYGRASLEPVQALARRELDFYVSVLVGHIARLAGAPGFDTHVAAAADSIGEKVLIGVRGLLEGDTAVLFPRVKPTPPPARSKTVGRNDPCPCNSGRKFKKCCGA